MLGDISLEIFQKELESEPKGFNVVGIALGVFVVFLELLVYHIQSVS